VNADRAARRIPDFRRLAFTTTEMIAVIVVIGVICGIAIPHINFTQYQVDAAVRTVRMAVQNAQRLAVTRQYNVIVSFDETSNRIRVLEDGNNNNAVDLGERVTWVPLQDGVNFATPPAGINGPVIMPVDGSDVVTIDGMPSIIFRRNGAGNTDLEVYLTSRRVNPNDFRGVTVLKATGRTDWYKYIGSMWTQGSI